MVAVVALGTADARRRSAGVRTTFRPGTTDYRVRTADVVVPNIKSQLVCTSSFRAELPRKGKGM
jgi:hypothetical protein